MGLSSFSDQLKILGFEDIVLEGNRVKFTYHIMSGKHKGKKITMGFDVPQDFPLNPPSGPHITPQILPVNPGAATHPEKVADSPFGSDWEYLSRPCTMWQDTGKDTETYMAFIFHIFDTL